MMPQKMRLMFISHGCSLQDEPGEPGMTARHEQLIKEYCDDRVELAVICSAVPDREPTCKPDGISYYPVDPDMRTGMSPAEWEEGKSSILAAIRDFGPDIIECFGSEWPYGAIAEDVSVPVVIHMMGFLNIYYPILDRVAGYEQSSRLPQKGLKYRIGSFLKGKRQTRNLPERPEEINAAFERRVMEANHYFLGRTGWDRNIVRYYSPGAAYYELAEPVKPMIYESAGTWKGIRQCEAAGTWKGNGAYEKTGKEKGAERANEKKPVLKLLTVSSADFRKGNEIILQTAWLLKNLLGLDFVWKVAGSKDYFDFFERRTGIDHGSVSVELLGMIKTPRIIEELQDADFFIHPSVIDNSPHSICEAQLIGCPVIASDVGGISDLVSDGESGFLYPYNEPHALAFLIGNLFKNQDSLTRISKREVEIAGKRHEPEKIAGRLYDIYKEIIADYEGRKEPGKPSRNQMPHM